MYDRERPGPTLVGVELVEHVENVEDDWGQKHNWVNSDINAVYSDGSRIRYRSKTRRADFPDLPFSLQVPQYSRKGGAFRLSMPHLEKKIAEINSDPNLNLPFQDLVWRIARSWGVPVLSQPENPGATTPSEA